MSTITLSEDQHRCAKDILQRLSKDEIVEPMDIVDRWRRKPDYDDLNIDRPVLEMNLKREHKYLSTSSIIGPGSGAADRLEQGRLKDIVELLVEGDFKQEPERPPRLEGINGDYYPVDGIHRALAFKSIGIGRIYAEVIEIPGN